MKKMLTLSLFVLTFFVTFGQNCTPDPAHTGKPAGVYPLPYDPATNPNGGITEIACVGQPFEFTFTSISDYFVYQGITYALDSFVLNDVQGLPEGLNYACFPSNCILEFQEVGCMKISGTPSASNAPGIYPLTITGTVHLFGGISLTVSFPNPNISPGVYQITLEGPNSPLCGFVAYDCPDSQDNIGDPCDDGDPNTTGETRQSDCSCAGGTIVYDCPASQDNIGDPCEDGDPNTTWEIRQSDCSCEGRAGVYPLPYDPTTNPDGGITEIACVDQPFEFIFTTVSDYYVYQGITYALDSFVLNDVQGLPEGLSYACDPPNCVLGFQEVGHLTISGTPSASNAPGFYPLTITGTVHLLGGISLNISFPNPVIFPGVYQITLEGPNSPLCGFVSYDCPANQANIGDPCEDGNPNTTGETIQIDCSCTVDIPSYNCPASKDNIGDPCEDGDPNTIGETRQADCSCAGGTVVYDCPDSKDNIGDPCEDGDPNTTGETRQPDCSCAVGTPVYDCFTLQANIGDPCEDGNPNTVGETILTNCGCGGGTYVYWCPGTQDNIGDPCEDGDPNTTGETRQADCSCAVTPSVYDCPSIQANIGDPCDDGNPNTSGETIQPDCSCAVSSSACIDPNKIDFNHNCTLEYNPVCGCNGITYANACIAEHWFGLKSWTPGSCSPQPYDCPNLQAYIGQACDDGNPNTYGDTVQDDCTCKGTPPTCVNPSQIDFDHNCSLEYNPVCGCDGVTYANACIAQHWFGLTSWAPGSCSPQPYDCPNQQAYFGQACNDGDPNTTGDVIQADCTCKGTGTPQSCINPYQIDIDAPCALNYNPVCGCNGVSYANVCIAENWFGVTQWTLGNCSSNQALAVPKMFVFDARLKDRQIRLDWGINWDPDVEYFLVERAIEDGTFESIGQIESRGENYRPRRYEFDDPSPNPGENVYRLVVVKTDGIIEYSDKKMVEFPINLEEFTLFPNPAKQAIFVNLRKYAGKKAFLELYNFQGTKIKELQIDELSEMPVKIDLDGMLNGMYTVTVKVEDTRRMSKVFVINQLY